MCSIPPRRDYIGVSPHNFDPNARPRQGMTSSFGRSRGQQFGRRNMGFGHQNGTHSVPLSFETVDDVVIITCPRPIREVRNHSRRNHSTIVLNDDLVVHQDRPEAIIAGEQTSTRLVLNDSNDHGRNPFGGGLFINLENNHATEEITQGREATTTLEPQITATKEPIFSCAVCMGPLVEETSTLCGHIFCKRCIVTAIQFQNKCPTCRQNLTINSIHRVYLPTAY